MGGSGGPGAGGGAGGEQARRPARTAPYDPHRPIVAVKLPVGASGEVRFPPPHPCWPGVYEVRLFSGQDESVCVAVSRPVVATAPIPRAAL